MGGPSFFTVLIRSLTTTFRRDPPFTSFSWCTAAGISVMTSIGRTVTSEVESSDTIDNVK